jgi:hypothetical protein
MAKPGFSEAAKLPVLTDRSGLRIQLVDATPNL